MEHEEYLSDASLIEDDEEEEEIDLPDEIPQNSSPPAMVIAEEDTELSEAEEKPAAMSDDSDEDFYGFEDHEIPEKLNSEPGDDLEDLNVPFPVDMSYCIGHYPGKLPSYEIQFAPVSPVVTIPKPAITEEEQPKVKPLKIKKPVPTGVSTPSPMLQRESREWKPSSQFFKPLNTGTFLFFAHVYI